VEESPGAIANDNNSINDNGLGNEQSEAIASWPQQQTSFPQQPVVERGRQQHHVRGGQLALSEPLRKTMLFGRVLQEQADRRAIVRCSSCCCRRGFQ